MEGVEAAISYQEDPYEATRGCHAIAVLTEWQQYNGLDFRNNFRSYGKARLYFRWQNIIDHQACFEIGFNVFSIARPP